MLNVHLTIPLVAKNKLQKIAITPITSVPDENTRASILSNGRLIHVIARETNKTDSFFSLEDMFIDPKNTENATILSSDERNITFNCQQAFVKEYHPTFSIIGDTTIH
jgi:hypothetical protein